MLLTRDHDGKTLLLATGSHVQLTLPENPTTGYRWRFDSVGLEIIDDINVMSAFPATGAGGARCIQFVASRKGAASISASLQRGWEAPCRAVDRCLFSFDVH